MQKMILLFALVSAQQVSLAQRTVLMGKLVDAHDAPVKQAELIVIKDDRDYKAVITKDGLYYTDSVYDGDYKVYVFVDKVTYEAKFKLIPPGKKPTFYNFKLANNKVEVSMVESDPFMEKELLRVKKEQAVYNY